jgi:hypothetical protein
MSDPDYPPIPCPFVYANGKRCPGHVRRAKAFGPKRKFRGELPREYVHKYRLWCTEKDDHAGILTSSLEAKERMEFYPDDLPVETLDALWGRGMVEF